VQNAVKVYVLIPRDLVFFPQGVRFAVMHTDAEQEVSRGHSSRGGNSQGEGLSSPEIGLQKSKHNSGL